MGGRQQYWLDRAAEGLGALAAGSAAATLGWSLGGWMAGIAGAVVGVGAGFAVVRRAGTSSPAYAIALMPIVSSGPDELLLDDPLPEPAEGSRVVRLFADGQQVALPQPGALAERIDRWLGVRDRADDGRGAATGDATAELHAALDDIRRSLG